MIQKMRNLMTSTRLSRTFRLGGLMVSLAIAQPALALKMYTTGSTTDVVRATSSMICLAGGGSDDAWAAGWREMLTRANGGDVVIIRADGTRGGYEDWIYNDPDMHNFPKVNSVQTISLAKASEANREDVAQKILNAELVFFAGGDQLKYIDWFRGSRLLQAVEHVMNVKKVPVGGTSAGLAILGGIDYTARYSSPTKKGAMVTSTDVLNNPTGTFVDLDRTVLTAPFLNQVVTDSHFSARLREGRLVGFMARSVYNNYSDVSVTNIKGIGVDEGTAACYDSTGLTRVFGTGKAFFLKGNAPIERIQPGSSLDWFAQRQAVQAYIVDGTSASAAFNLTTWSGTGGTSQFWYVDGTNPSSAVFGRN